MDTIQSLKDRIDEAAVRGVSLPWGACGVLAPSVASIEAAARVVSGWMELSTDAVLGLPILCCGERGLLLVTAVGNYKDEATLLASSALITTFATELGAPLLAECDVAPALRRAMLDGHARIVALSGEPLPERRFGTVGGPRPHLRGIGASVAAALVLPRRAWITSVGECRVWLHRDGEVRRLNLPDTLASDPTYRATMAGQPDTTFEDAENIITRVLGATDEPPPFNVTRVDLAPGDRILVASELLAQDAKELIGRTAETPTAFCRRVAEARCPGVVAVVGVLREGSRGGA